jgi:hypothetical protein
MDSILIIFIKTGLTGFSGFCSPGAKSFAAEGRTIPMILLILSNYFFKKEPIPFFFSIVGFYMPVNLAFPKSIISVLIIIETALLIKVASFLPVSSSP